MPIKDYDSRYNLAEDNRGGNAEKISVQIKSIAIQGELALELAQPGVTLIVGGNNVGKSTLLHQMHSSLTASPLSSAPASPLILTDQQVVVGGSSADAHAWVAKHGHAGTHFVDMQGATFHHSLIDQVWANRDRGHLDAFGEAMTLAPNARSRFEATRPADRRAEFTDPPTAHLHYIEDDTSLMNELNEYTEAIFGQGLTMDALSGRLLLRFGKTTVEAPPINHVTPEYRKALSRLKSLEEQGDGVASTLGLLIPLVAGRNPIAFIDEPEAYLHPPQAFKLGQVVAGIAKRRKSQFIIATHDKNFVAGALSHSDIDQTVIRLERSMDVVRGHRVNPVHLRDIWSSPLLRHSNILDGLFHRAVVIAENERDCLFYAAATESRASVSGGIPPNDLLFVSSHGKSGVAEMATILTSAHVPVVAVLDLDALREKAALKKTVIALGGAWHETLDSDYDRATAEFRGQRKAWKRSQVLAAVTSVLEIDSDQDYGSEQRKAIQSVLSVDNPWAEVKRYGIAAFRADRPAADRLMVELRKQGVVLVSVGELENFAPSLGVRKGSNWLPAALEANAHMDSDACTLADAVIDAILHRERL